MKSQTFKYWEDSLFESLLGKHLKICYLKEKNRLNKLSVTANDNSQNGDFSFSFEVQKRDCHNNNKDATIYGIDHFTVVTNYLPAISIKVRPRS